MNGKGSKQRPLSISQEEFASNWDNIFSKKQYTLEVKETSEGEQYIEFSDEMLDRVGWKEGDEIEITKVKEGLELKKKT